MKANFNNSLFAVLSMTVLMACSSTRNATAQYPNNDNDDNYENYDDDDAYNDNEDSYNEPSEADVNINVFVNELNPYGRWVNSPSYGQVWICNEPDFTPYQTRGHWVYSNYGWTWASDYRWGWAPFHYGRWANDPFYGWMWVPGYQWGPAWVGWRTGGDYYGWAPLSPGININIGFGFGNNYPANNWCFLPRRYMGYNNFNHYVVNRSRNVTIIRNTTIINNTNIYRNTRYATGPNRTEVERYTGRRINELRVTNSTRPGATRITNNNTVNIYRPQANRTPDKKDVVRNDDRNKNNRDKRIDANGAPSHDNNTPGQNPRIIRTPEKRNDNNNDRKPDPRDKVNNDNRNRNDDHTDVNRDRNNDINKDRNNDIRNKPPQQNDNRFPDNRNNQQNNRPDTKRPPSNWDNRNNDQNRNNEQRPDYNNNRNNGQRPDFNNNRNNSNGRTWQPSQQQPQRNAPARPAPQQRESSKRKPA